jgi:hypothetical protein
VVGGPVKNLVIRDSEIHLSGDAIQFDPGRQLPGWSDSSRGLQALTPAGERRERVRGRGRARRERHRHEDEPCACAKLTVVDTTAWGFQKGLITNMAAFNLKENTRGARSRDGVRLEIALHARPGSNGAPGCGSNAVVHDVAKAVRYEHIEKLGAGSTSAGASRQRSSRRARGDEGRRQEPWCSAARCPRK